MLEADALQRARKPGGCERDDGKAPVGDRGACA